MLDDDALFEIAQRHVRERYAGDFEPVRGFSLSHPSGVYYRPDSPSGAGATPGDAGFFIDRQTGAVRHFNSGELMVGLMLAERLHGSHDGRTAVQMLLTHSPEELLALRLEHGL